MTFAKDNIVEILPEFQDEGDDQFTWVVMGDEEKGRVDIQPVDINLKIRPVYTVRTDQIQLAVQPVAVRGAKPKSPGMGM